MNSISTPLSRRKVKLAVWLGIITGIISAIVKFGWEIPFPPRTPERDLTNPPQQLLEQLGMSYDMSHLVYYFNGNPRPIMSFIVHFSFAIFFAILYCVIAEYKPKIKLWQGTAYGLVIYIVFHVILMPLMGTVPAPWDQPFEEHFSELFGHMFWTWIIEICRRDIRNRITHEPDAEIPLTAPFR
ncbi:YagU family protein [Apibacter raozihei]|uniref:YagU family protein n=1 Tax=Apibacter TaxID=1778601 RepID=UPI000FE2B40B|nr:MULTISPECIES: YagU family protein [Apibacter]